MFMKFNSKEILLWGNHNKKLTLVCSVILLLNITTSVSASEHEGVAGQNTEIKNYLTLHLNSGKMANYGATPWYTTDVLLGANKMKFALDSGSNFTWATSALCMTEACDAQLKVSSNQEGFSWLDPSIVSHSFGPWGTMQTRTATVNFKIPGAGGHTGEIDQKLTFYAAVDYTGKKFQDLTWGGGISFPSESSAVAGEGDNRSAFLVQKLLQVGDITQPSFAVYTDRKRHYGEFYIGGEDKSKYNEASEVILKPNRTGSIGFIWGTSLHKASLGKQALPLLNNARFYLDSGSSRFKGDSNFIVPILEFLYQQTYNDHGRQAPVFEKVFDDQGNWTGLAYVKGMKPYNELPDFNLTIGQSCKGIEGKAAMVSLSPKQYSYKVKEGAQKGRWVVAFSVLDGVGGLLVGSTFMDLLFTKFEYKYDANSNELTQGNMYLYQKRQGEGPSSFQCVDIPEKSKVFSPLSGTWYNSYCSQVELAVHEDGKIKGVYTSHTGSVGSSDVIGFLGQPKAFKKGSSAIVGIPVAMGIQWRLITEKQTDANATWHWMSGFSGQYQPAQQITEAGQMTYSLPETLYLLNVLNATSQFPGYNATSASKLWPENLSFHKIPASYCAPVTPPKRHAFTPSAKDHISGIWKNIKNQDDVLEMRLDPETFAITGTLKKNNIIYRLTGLGDPIAVKSHTKPYAKLDKVFQQGVVLSFSSKIKGEKLISMVGGIDLTSTKHMYLWVSELSSTTWTNRFTQSTFDQQLWTKKSK